MQNKSPGFLRMGFWGWISYGFDPMGFFTTLHHHLGEYVCHICKHLKQLKVFGFGKRMKKSRGIEEFLPPGTDHIMGKEKLS